MISIKQVVIISLSILPSHLFGQEIFSFNQGGTAQTNYHLTIPYVNVKEKIIIQVTIGDRERRFIVDTGAPTMIIPELKKELKSEVVKVVPITDANQEKDSLETVCLASISIDSIVFNDIPAVVAKSSSIFECFEVEGIIGSNLLRNSVVQFDHNDQIIKLVDKPDKLSLSGKQYADLSLDDQNSPIITIKLKNKRKVMEEVLFDTGMQGLYDVSLGKLEALQQYKTFEFIAEGHGSNTFGLLGLAKGATHYKLHLPTMEINGVDLLNITTETVLGNNSSIGSKLLRFGIVTLDYPNQKFYFEPYVDGDIDVDEKQFPLSIVPADDRLFVGIVWDEALSKKINIGDQVIAIDGVNYESISICDYLTSQILEGKDKVMLTTKNELGEIQDTSIERR